MTAAVSERPAAASEPVAPVPSIPKSPGSSWNQVKLGGGLGALDINNLTARKEDDSAKETVLLTGDEYRSFETDELLKEWHRLADAYKSESKINIFTLMTANPPRLLDRHMIEITIENRIQEDLLLVEKPDIVNALRTSLKNYAIDIRTVMQENNTVRKPYTAQEKYQAMVQKNEVLDRMRQDFNLGLE